MPALLLGLFSGARKLLLKAWEWFTDDPWRLFIIAAAVFAFLWWRADARAGRAEAKIAAMMEASKAVVEADKSADLIATEAAKQAKGEIDASNERARAAARNSSDPLRDGLDSLRAEGRGSGDKAAR